MPVEGKKSRAWIAVLLVVLVLILGGGGYFAYTNYFANSPLPSPTAVSAALLPATETSEPTLEVTPTSPPQATEIPSPNPNRGAHCHACSSPPSVGADKIAFISEKNVWAANLDGTELTQLTQSNSGKDLSALAA